MADLAELLDRVKAATGPNYDLEERIALALEPDRLTHFRTPPAYTASLDAALALVERVLPGWEAKISTGDPTRNRDLGEPTASLIPHMGNDDDWALGPAARREAQATTPALALLAALLSALIARADVGSAPLSGETK